MHGIRRCRDDWRARGLDLCEIHRRQSDERYCRCGAQPDQRRRPRHDPDNRVCFRRIRQYCFIRVDSGFRDGQGGYVPDIFAHRFDRYCDIGVDRRCYIGICPCYCDMPRGYRIHRGASDEHDSEIYSAYGFARPARGRWREFDVDQRRGSRLDVQSGLGRRSHRFFQHPRIVFWREGASRARQVSSRSDG